MNDAIGQGILGEPAAPQNIVREVVGVFPDPAALQAAVEQLGIAGIDRAAISVLGVVLPQTMRKGLVREFAAK